MKKLNSCQASHILYFNVSEFPVAFPPVIDDFSGN